MFSFRRRNWARKFGSDRAQRASVAQEVAKRPPQRQGLRVQDVGLEVLVLTGAWLEEASFEEEAVDGAIFGLVYVL